MSKTDLSLQRIDGPATVTKDEDRLWFVVPPLHGAFRSVAAIDEFIKGAGLGWSKLVGHDIKIRVTSHPYPTEKWARALDANTPNPLPGWGEFLKAEQRKVMRLTLADKVVYVGVDLLAPARKRATEIREISDAMAGYGLGARPVTSSELEWLLHRSVALGAPAPLTLPPPMEEWDTGDVASFTDRVQWVPPEPYGRTTRITADVNDRLYVQHVCVVTLGRIGNIAVPEQMGPWMQRLDRLPWPTEVSMTLRPLPMDEVVKRMRGTRDRAEAQLDHYENDHKQTAPKELRRKIKRALHIQDRVQEGDQLERWGDWWVRVAVFARVDLEPGCSDDDRRRAEAEAEETAVERAAAVTTMFAPQFTFERGADQYRSAREFIPGEPLANEAHRRFSRLTTFAGAIPQMTSMVGDRIGPHLGETCGESQRAVCWDTHRAMEIGEGAGTTVIGGKPGAGKSVLVGKITHQATRRGIRCVLLDPVDRLGGLARIEAIAPYSESVNLMHAQPGALNPYWLLSEPLETHHPDNYTDVVEMTRAERSILAYDTILGLLPAKLAADKATERALEAAVGKVPGLRTSSPLDVVEALEHSEGSLAEHGADVASRLRRIAVMPQGRLIFPRSRDWAAERPGDVEKILRIYTMRGNTLPPASMKPEGWNMSQRLGVAALALASYLTMQHVVSRDPHERKLIGIDEVHAIAGFPAGMSLLTQLTREFTRHWNVRILLSDQVIDWITGIEEFIDCSFIGTTTSEQGIKDAMRIQGIEPGAGFEKVYPLLSSRARGASEQLGYREWVFNDGEGGIEKIRVRWSPEEAAVLNTTATGRVASPPPPSVPADEIDELEELVSA